MRAQVTERIPAPSAGMPRPAGAGGRGVEALLLAHAADLARAEPAHNGFNIVRLLLRLNRRAVAALSLIAIKAS
jgi:hypothetical protein